MVRYPAERQRRAARREGTNVQRGKRVGKRQGHSSMLSLVCGYFLDGVRARVEVEKKRWRMQERRGMEGRGQCGFCLLPTFQSQSWKMNRQKKINCMTFTERKREIERAGEEGGRRREKHIMEGRSKRTGKAEGRKSTMTPVEHSRSACLGVSLCSCSTLKNKAFFKKMIFQSISMLSKFFFGRQFCFFYLITPLFKCHIKG